MTDAVQRDQLPIPDFDHLPVTGLGHRIRSLAPSEIEVLLAYERAHADRLPVVQVLQVRLDELAGGASPSDGDAGARAPELAPPPSGTGPVDPSTTAPRVAPPSHGVPTNPSQEY